MIPKWTPPCTCAPPPATKRSRLPRSTHSKCTRSCWLTIAHLIVFKTKMIRAEKILSVRSQTQRTNPHTCEMPRNWTSSRETTRNPLTICELPIKKSQRFHISQLSVPTQKSEENSRLFPCTGTTGPNVPACISSTIFATDLVVDQTLGCFLQYCLLCRFPIVTCLDREILGHTLFQLARPPFVKILRGRNPQSSCRVFPSAQILHERNEFANRESWIFNNPCDSPF